MQESDIVSLDCKLMALILSLQQGGILPRREFVRVYQVLLEEEKDSGTLEPGQIARWVDKLDGKLEGFERALKKGSGEPS